MLKLMKYEFRKMRTTLLVLMLILVALEGMFILGRHLDKDRWVLTSVVLLTMLAFATYGYILVAGIASYSRELGDRTGYLAFMTPTRPIGIVLSKLVFTLLAGTAVTALFAAAAFLDYSQLARTLNLDESMLNQINLSLKFMFGDMTVTVNSIAQALGFTVLSALIEVGLSICTAYLAITVSATLLQNRRGFLRGLVSVLLFIGLSWGASWLSNKVIELVPRFWPVHSVASMDVKTLFRQIWVSLGLHLILGGIFAVVSASLLKRKVSL